MTVLGTATGRMKDFYDLWLLSQSFEFDGYELRRAIEATFATRNTPIETTPVALSSAFAQMPEVQQRWAGFLRKSGLHGSAPESIVDVIGMLEGFVGSILRAVPRPRTWQPPGPWQT